MGPPSPAAASAAASFLSSMTSGMTRIPASFIPRFTGELLCRVAIISSS